ncbi:MAG: 3-deoxy-D-manno-octulosonic acid kinase [Ferrimonas sp.]
MQQETLANQTLLLATGSVANRGWFDRDWLAQQQAVVGQSEGSGRNPALFLQLAGGAYVLRHYYRGGLPGRLIRDRYLWLGLTRTRAYQELHLLEQLVALNLPVSKPVAAQIVRVGGCYRAELITERLQGCQDLIQWLQQRPLALAQWQALGGVLARFHRHGVYHADLNGKNILFDGQQFYLIDFDRGALRAPESRWQQANLMRLARSFKKEQQRAPTLHWQIEDWHALQAAYQVAYQAP